VDEGKEGLSAICDSALVLAINSALT